MKVMLLNNIVFQNSNNKRKWLVVITCESNIVLILIRHFNSYESYYVNYSVDTIVVL